MYGLMDMDLYRFLERMDRILACGYIDTTYVARIKHISKKLLNMINSKVTRRKTHTRARESHRKPFLEEEEEK